MRNTDLWDFRKRHGLTCIELADKIGVHRSNVTRWENGQQKIPLWLDKFLACLDRIKELEGNQSENIDIDAEILANIESLKRELAE